MPKLRHILKHDVAEDNWQVKANLSGAVQIIARRIGKKALVIVYETPMQTKTKDMRQRRTAWMVSG